MEINPPPTKNKTLQSPTKSTKTNHQFLIKPEVTTAEIVWTLGVVASNSSSQNDKPALFKQMFPDSMIAKAMTASRPKMAYLLDYGIAPNFVQLKCVNKLFRNTRHWGTTG